MTKDLKYALRRLRKSPWFSLAVITVMALSIGACTSIFSVVKTVLFAPLPYSCPERLVLLWHTLSGKGAGVVGMSPHDYMIYRDTTQAFESVGAVTTRGYNLGTSEPVRVTCGRVTENMFPLLGARPLRGRWFDQAEDRDGANHVIIISHESWQARFGGDESIIGKTISLDLMPYRVVGIMPKSFSFPPEGVQGLARSDCWVPTGFSPTELATPTFDFVVIGKLKPGGTFTRASVDAAAAAQRVLQSYPAAVQKAISLTSRVVPLNEQVVARSRIVLFVFACAVGLLLLIGCGNVANLMLARLQGRQREMAIRTALGSSRFELARQLFAECIVLASCGGVIGILVAAVLLRVLIAVSPGNLPRLDQAHIDPLTLLFTVVCSLLSGLLFGLAPAARLQVTDVARGLTEGGRNSSSGLRGNRLRSTLVVAEISMALVLLIGAGLLFRSFLKLTNLPPGFDARNVLTFSVSLPDNGYRQAADVNRFVTTLLERMRRVPTVTYAASGTSLPLGTTSYTVISRPDAPPESAGFKPAAIHTISSDYQSALGITLKHGRLLQSSDRAGGVGVALVSEAMASQYWPDVDAVGKQMQWIGGGPLLLTVVGVVADVHQDGLEGAMIPALYVPIAQSPEPIRNLVFVVRTMGSPVGIIRGVREVVREVDRTLPIFGMQSAEQVLSRSTAPRRFNLFLLSVFAVSALVLAAVGIYAVTSYTVSQSSREIGIRIALGATSNRILTMVMTRGLALTVVGLILGSGAAVALTQFMSSLLFGIPSTDSLTFTCVAALLVTISMVAILVPALRATSVDPAISLRSE